MGQKPGALCRNARSVQRQMRLVKAINPNPPPRVNTSPLDSFCPHHGIPTSSGHYPDTPGSEVSIMSVIVPRRNEAQQHSSSPRQRPRCKSNLQSRISANKSKEKCIVYSAASSPMTTARRAHFYIALRLVS